MRCKICIRVPSDESQSSLPSQHFAEITQGEALQRQMSFYAEGVGGANQKQRDMEEDWLDKLHQHAAAHRIILFCGFLCSAPLDDCDLLSALKNQRHKQLPSYFN